MSYDSDNRKMCYFSKDIHTEAHMNYNNYGKSFHIQCLHSCHEDVYPCCLTSWKPSSGYVKQHDLIFLLKKRELLTALRISIQKARMNFDEGKF